MSRHDPRVTLLQIVEHASRAQQLCSENPLNALVADWKLTMAFERSLEILGEAVKRLPPELRAKYPAVAWREITGMRDFLSHGYDGIDYQRLWDAVQKDVPGLLKTVEQMLADLAEENSNRPNSAQ